MQKLNKKTHRLTSNKHVFFYKNNNKNYYNTIYNFRYDRVL